MFVSFFNNAKSTHDVLILNKNLSKNTFAPLNKVLLCCLKSTETSYMVCYTYHNHIAIHYFNSFFYQNIQDQISLTNSAFFLRVNILKLFICQSIAYSPNMSWPLKTKGWLHLNTSLFYTVACKDISTTSPLWNWAQVFITAKPLKSLWQHETHTGNIIFSIGTQHTDSRSLMHAFQSTMAW